MAAMPYDRYLDVLVTGSNGWYDFVQAFQPQSAYMRTKMGGGSSIAVTMPPNTLKGIVTAGTATLPTTGYVAAAISITEISAGTQRPEIQRLIGWVGDTSYAGKLRINCHGDPDGSVMFMNTDAAGTGKELCLYYRIGEWLQKNGLAMPSTWKKWTSSKRGLSTINLAVCHSARPRVASASSVGITGSGVEQVSQYLNGLGYTGISVTGHDLAFSIAPDQRTREMLAVEGAEVAADTLLAPGTKDSLWDDINVAKLKAETEVEKLIHGLGLPVPRATALVQRIKNGNLSRVALRQVAVDGLADAGEAWIASNYQNIMSGKTAVGSNGPKQPFGKSPTKVQRTS
jgi:hypothetical protein